MQFNQDIANSLDSVKSQNLKFKAEKSYYQFVIQAFENVPSINKGQAFINNWHIEHLCTEIQKRIEKLHRGEKVKGLIVTIPPGTMKSIICTVAPAAWAWIKFPEFAHMGVSNSDGLSTGHCLQTRDIIQSDWFINNWGTTLKIREDSNQKTLFKNPMGGQRYSSGIGGTATGLHFHMVSFDDILSPDKADSEVERSNANQVMVEKFLSRHINPKSFFPLLVMQRVNDNDPVGFLLREQPDEWDLIQLPADDSEEIIPHELKENYVDGLLFPARFPRETLVSKRAQMGEQNYRTQYLLSPSSAGGNLICGFFLNTEIRPGEYSMTVER